MGQITIIGLGPGSPELLTRQAFEILGRAKQICVRTSRHPVIREPWLHAAVISFDDVYDAGHSLASASQVVAERIVALAEQSAEVVYAVPGTPLVGDCSVRRIEDLARQRTLPVRIVPGVSTFELACQSLRVDPLVDGIVILDAAQIASRLEANGEEAFDPFSGKGRALDPTKPVMISQIHGTTMLAAVKRALGEIYPAHHPVSVIGDTFVGSQDLRTVSLERLDVDAFDGAVGCLYLQPIERLADLASFDTLRYIVARLRAPDGCPWDREQTHHSMKKHFIEETYEVIAALDDDDWGKFVEELGDVMLQVVMHCQLGLESRSFSLEDVFRAVNEKLVRRHPHVFGDVKVSSSADVLRNWERIKRGESATGSTSFSTIPESMPALMRADAVQSRAARYGWTPVDGVPDLQAFEHPAVEPNEARRAIGECLFDLVALARKHDVDPEEALRLATNRFAERLQGVLDALQDAQSSFDLLPLDERRRLVREALERRPGDENPSPPRPS